MEMQNEKAKNHQYEEICNYVFVHGQTHYQMDCRNRHLILPHDILDEPIVQCNQLLRFQLLKMRSPTEYIIRPLTAKYTTGWKTINSSDTYAKDFYLRFVNHYKKKTNKMLKNAIMAGELGVTFDAGHPCRCQIIKQRPKV